MAEDIEHLVLAPFREIAEKGRLAMQNAIAAEPDKAQVMKKLGNALVKEGERAVKRMEPLCQRHHEKSGSYFVDALKDEDKITEHRWTLNEKLWDFEDYTDSDTFEPERFAELQRLSREVAPSIINILMTMSVEVPLPLYAPSPPHTSATSSFEYVTGPPPTEANEEGLKGPMPRRLPDDDFIDVISHQILESAPEEAPRIPPKSRSRKLGLGAPNKPPREVVHAGRRRESFPPPVAPPQPSFSDLPNPPNRLSPRSVVLLASSPSYPERGLCQPESAYSFSPVCPPIPEEQVEAEVEAEVEVEVEVEVDVEETSAPATTATSTPPASSQESKSSQSGSLCSLQSSLPRLSMESVSSSVCSTASIVTKQKHPSLPVSADELNWRSCSSENVQDNNNSSSNEAAAGILPAEPSREDSARMSCSSTITNSTLSRPMLDLLQSWSSEKEGARVANENGLIHTKKDFAASPHRPDETTTTCEEPRPEPSPASPKSRESCHALDKDEFCGREVLEAREKLIARIKDQVPGRRGCGSVRRDAHKGKVPSFSSSLLAWNVMASTASYPRATTGIK